MRLAVVLQEFKLVQVITSDCLRRFSAIANDLNLVVERDDPNLSLACTVRHVVDLRVDGGFDALDTRHVCHSSVLLAEKLV